MAISRSVKPPETRRASFDYDFVLTLVTILVVALIAMLFVGGTVYTFFVARSNPAWTNSLTYARYLDAMNASLIPLLAALVAILGLCIPRRLLRRRSLVAASTTMLMTTLLLLVGVGLEAAWGFLLATAAIIQIVVLVMTAARSRRVSYVQEGFLMRIGSAMLHLGLVVLVATFVLGLSISAQLSVFWVATALIMLGTTMSFYSRELSRLIRRQPRVSDED